MYLSVGDLPGGEDMEARVERVESGSAFSLLFERGADLEALDEQEDYLRTGPNGVTGIVKFVLKTNSGEAMPPGNYTVNVYGARPASEADGAVAARKFFLVEG